MPTDLKSAREHGYLIARLIKEVEKLFDPELDKCNHCKFIGVFIDGETYPKCKLAE